MSFSFINQQVKVLNEDKIDKLNSSAQSIQEDVRKKPLPVAPKVNQMKRTDYTPKTVDVDGAMFSFSKM